MDISEHVNNILDQMLAAKVSPSDFNSIEYINRIFPNEQSLSNIDEVLRILKEKIAFLDTEIRSVICSQKSVEENGRRTLEDAQTLILSLTNVIKEIKGQAKQSEKIVNEITCNIKQLDNAKRNLTASIIMLNNLHILVQGTQILKDTTKKRQYGAAAKTLQGILDVLKHFSRFRHIPHILRLVTEIEEVCARLGAQILADFYATFDLKNVATPPLTSAQIHLLAEACLVLSILEPKYKRELLAWFVDSELSEYRTLFAENQDIAWLDKVDKRFAWLKKHLIVFEEKIGFLFPPSWEVSECIAVEFCRLTRRELVKVMNNRSLELDVAVLLPAISKATAFEKLLSQRFTGVTLTSGQFASGSGSAGNLAKKSSGGGGGGGGGNPFSGLITVCFENYLNIYVEAQDRSFAKMIDQFVEEQRKAATSSSSANSSSSETSSSSSTARAEILPTSGKLFTQYKNCLIQCISLSNRMPLVLLSTTFQKYLREYAHKILQAAIPRVGSAAGGGGGSGSSGGVLSLGASLSSTLSSAASAASAASGAAGGLSAASSSAAAGLLQIFMKDLENRAYSVPEIVQLCAIILTAHYCLETTQQLERKITEKVDSSLVERISFSGECDIFHATIVNCIQLLTHSIEYSCEQPLLTMIKTAWSNVDTPIGPSAYVSSLTATFHQLFPVIRENLHELPAQYYAFCLRFATAFIAKFIANLYRCKPLSHGGAEQLLLDSHTLKRTLLELPEYGATATVAMVMGVGGGGGGKNVPNTAAYSSTVVNGMTKAEMILKIVLVSAAPPEMFVENYFKLIHEKDISEFQKVLDMKGIKKAEAAVLSDLFRKKCLTLSSGGAGAGGGDHQRSTGGVSAGVNANETAEGSEETAATASAAELESSRIKKLEKLIKKRL